MKLQKITDTFNYIMKKNVKTLHGSMKILNIFLVLL